MNSSAAATRGAARTKVTSASAAKKPPHRDFPLSGPPEHFQEKRVTVFRPEVRGFKPIDRFIDSVKLI
ncbi:hypothetical protein Q1M63_21840 [Sinorhizobium meliloti]|nr:hypothetical protein Q1M63_21840 [Sinorhizobium meliloti]